MTKNGNGRYTDMSREQLLAALEEIAKHEPITDNRDLRDPQSLGEFLLDTETTMTAREVYDKLADLSTIHIPDYDPDPVDHSQFYRKELEMRASEGDKFAAEVLEGHADREPTDR